MLWWIIQVTVLSVLLIFLVHHLIDFFKFTLTVPKIKDLVNTPSQKYEDMYNIIQKEEGSNRNQQQEYTMIDLLPSKSESNMKNELKNFLKSQLEGNNTIKT